MPWGEAGGKGEVSRLARKPDQRVLGVRGDEGGRDASGVAHESLVVGDKEGGREASGVAENPWGYRQGVGGGVKSPQGTDAPGVSELSWGEEIPRVTTAGEGELGEDGRGQEGEETPPIT